MQVRTHGKRESVMQSMHNKTDYPFDYFFEHATSKGDSVPDSAHLDSDQTSSLNEGLVVEETKGSKVKGDDCDDSPQIQ